MPEIDDDVDVESVMKILKWMFTELPAQAARKLIKLLPLFALHIYLPALWGTCQIERSQHQNREVAMRMLKSKLVEIKERENLERIEDIKGDQKEIAWGSQIRSYVLCHTQWLKTTELILKWVILPQLWMVTLTVSLTLI